MPAWIEIFWLVAKVAVGMYIIWMLSFMLCNWLDFRYGVTLERRHMEGPELCLRRYLWRRWKER